MSNNAMAFVEVGQQSEYLETIEDLFDWIDDLDDAPDCVMIDGSIVKIDDLERFKDWGTIPLDVASQAIHDGLDEVQGFAEDAQEFVMNFLEECHSDLFKIMRDVYVTVDWEATTRDHMMDFCSYRSKIDGKVWIFR